ncbi:hypothetical protein [uncultured Paraglaciecola sp.]|uniref:hypothetical protein n=1 Tax=uncultured Paraglaciecola sp. TaxID=1765024 RepID=UPI00260AEB37|nr:hypothetical protein [uncultured Paraglaciecola sp.]
MTPQTFESDGCSYWPDGTYSHCCVDHDWLWFIGVTFWDKVSADWNLLLCVAQSSAGWAWGLLMFVGVSTFGLPIWIRKRRADK